jgi:hypothetical protein
MRAQDWLTLIALLLGPVSAVLISLRIEGDRRTRDGRLRIVRMLLSTRHMPAHPDWNVAINLIPLEFNDRPEVLEAWRRYHSAVRDPAPKGYEEDHQRRVGAAQTSLIFRAMIAAGLKNVSEGDIASEVYVSQGFVDRDAIYVESLKALPHIAATMKEQADFMRGWFSSQRQQSPPHKPS